MKKLISLLFLFSSFSISSTAFTLDECLNNLKTFQKNDLIVTKTKTKKNVAVKLQEILTSLEDCTKIGLANKTKTELIKEVVRVSVIALEADPSGAAAEIILPLYRLQKTEFDKIIETLPKTSRSLIKGSLENVAREESVGNG